MRLSPMILVASLAVADPGCAEISGLDQIEEAQCAPNCRDDAGNTWVRDATADAPVDVAPEIASDTAYTPDTQYPPDACDALADRSGGDSTPADSSDDAVTDWNVEASSPTFDSGCGRLDVIENCSACGDTCAKASNSVTSAQCTGRPDGSGATCSYTCSTGYLDCDMTAQPPDLDGCECFAPAATMDDCCAGGCPMPHDNGLNQPTSLFYECSMSADTIALDACAAFTGDASQCSDLFYCGTDPDASTTDLLVCSSGSSTDCVCWDYSGPNAGYVHDSKEAPGSRFQNCDCPSSQSDPSYL